jgi:broad specificity phosphatase PhoE
MSTLYLVRHGRAAASWGESADPGLDDTGREQAAGVPALLDDAGPMPIVSSPMTRARETAAPLAGIWNCTPHIDPRFSEIPTPADVTAARKAWIKSVLSKTWPELGADLQAYRDRLIRAACAMERDTVVFTHFIAINTLVGKALNDSRVLIFWPDNASITTLQTGGAALELVEKGIESPSIIG